MTLFLQRIIRRNDLSLINHPVILELIKLKAHMYGDYWIRIDIILSVLFTVIWTSCASIRVNEFDSENSVQPGSHTTRVTVLVLAVIAQLLTFLYMHKVSEFLEVNFLVGCVCVLHHKKWFICYLA